MIAERIGDCLSYGLAMCGSLNGFSSGEVHGEFGFQVLSFLQVCRLRIPNLNTEVSR